MSTNKKIIVLCSIILAIIVLLWTFGRKIVFSPVATSTPIINEENDRTDKINLQAPDLTLPLSAAPKDVAWAIFQKYLSYNKNKDANGIRSVVYKIASVCEEPKTRIDCEARMGSAYSYGSTLKKEDFTKIWNDKNQIILVTDFWTESSKDLDQYGRFRSIIFFVKGSDGEWKLLGFSPAKGNATSKGEASQEEVDTRLIRYTEDKDEDGIADYVEECIPAEIKDTCVPTDPKLRDTDGDGLWDGTEALME